MKKIQKVLLFIFLVAIFSSGVSTVLALEVKYPNIPGLPPLNGAYPEIGDYIKYFFGLLVYLAGALGLISFVIGAVGLINPSVESHSNAKDRMKSAILGLTLTLASFIIMQTINPKLVNPGISPQQNTDGVFYFNSSDPDTRTNRKPANVSGDDKDIPTGFNKITYDCTSGPSLLLWKFPRTGQEKGASNLNDVVVEKIACGGSSSFTQPFAVGSFRWEKEKTGIYFCYGKNGDSGCNGSTNLCSGFMSSVFTESQDNIAGPFTGKIKAVYIVNSPADNINYGVIFHQTSDLKKPGYCTSPIFGSSVGGACIPLGTNPSAYTVAADVFNVNVATPKTSGEGVDFYTEPFVDGIGTRAGSYKVTKDSIPRPSISYWWTMPKNMNGDAYSMKIDYTGVRQLDEYKTANDYFYKSFNNTGGSIDIKGNYLVAVYSEYGIPNQMYCRTFSGRQTIANLTVQSIVQPNKPKLDGPLYIIPLVPNAN